MGFAGIIAMCGFIVAMIYMEGSHIGAILLPAPMLLVIGCTVAAGAAGGTVKDFLGNFGALPKIMIGKYAKPTKTVERIAELSTIARKNSGLLGLESEIGANGKDVFMDEALTALVKGIDGDALRDTLDDKSETVRSSEMGISNFFATLGGYAPTMGIVGTVVSLVHVLENLSEPEHLGHMIAAAFVATFWGLATANVIWHPLSARARRIAELNALNRDLVCEGIALISEGDSPMVIQSKLNSKIPARLLEKPTSGKK